MKTLDEAFTEIVEAFDVIRKAVIDWMEQFIQWLERTSKDIIAVFRDMYYGRKVYSRKRINNYYNYIGEKHEKNSY